MVDHLLSRRPPRLRRSRPRRHRLRLEALEHRTILSATFAWSAAGVGNWSDAGNWTIASGADVDGIPDADDTALFDATSVQDAVVDLAFAGAIGEVRIDPGYTGTIRLDRDLAVAGTFSQSGGTFDFDNEVDSGTDTLSVRGDFTVSGASTTFDADDGVVVLTCNSSQTVSSASPPYDLVARVPTSRSLYLASDLTVSGAFSVEQAYQIGGPGSVQGHVVLDMGTDPDGVLYLLNDGFHVDGDLTIEEAGSIARGNPAFTAMLGVSGNVLSLDPSVVGNGPVSLVGAGNQTLSGGDLPDGGVLIDKADTSTTVTLGSNLAVSSMTVAKGTLDLDGHSLAVTGEALTVAADGAVIVHLDAAAPPQVDVDGEVALASTLTVRLIGGFVPTGGDTFTIVDNDGIDAVVGTFAGLPEGALLTVGESQFQISYGGGTGNDVVLTVVPLDTTPPEVLSVDVGTDLRTMLVQLNDDLDMGRATNPANYRVIAAHGDADGDGDPFNDGDETELAIESVQYDPATDQIRIAVADVLFEDRFRLELDGDDTEGDGTPGIADLAGNLLAGGHFAAELDLTSLGMIGEVIASVEALGIDAGAENSLVAKLEAVARVLYGDIAPNQGVLTLLDIFIAGVERWHERGEITAEGRDSLIAQAELIRLGITLTDDGPAA